MDGLFAQLKKGAFKDKTASSNSVIRHSCSCIKLQVDFPLFPSPAFISLHVLASFSLRHRPPLVQPLLHAVTVSL